VPFVRGPNRYGRDEDEKLPPELVDRYIAVFMVLWFLVAAGVILYTVFGVRL
jgi:hypothetical protein